jgi:signal peptidase
MSHAVSHDAMALGVRGTRVKTTARRRRRRVGNLLFLLVALVVVFLWMTQLRPQRLGGTTDYVMVRGVSMLPTYRSGDLVLVKPALSYGAGDIVAYHVPAGDVGAGLTVIHRIVGGSATRGFLTKGDNNDDVDDWHPKGPDIEGVPWAVVPQGGRILAFLHAPVPLGALAAAIAVMALSYEGRDTPKEKKRKHRRRSTTPERA